MNKFLWVLVLTVSFATPSFADTPVIAPSKETNIEIEQKTEKEIKKEVKDKKLATVSKDKTVDKKVKETMPLETPKPPVKEDKKYLVRDAITGQKVEQKSPFDGKNPKESLRDNVRKKFNEK